MVFLGPISRNIGHKKTFPSQKGYLVNKVQGTGAADSPGGSIPGPVITLSVTEDTIYDFEIGDYQPPSATAVDFYGNSIPVTLPVPPDSSDPGILLLTYTATDTFGNTSTVDLVLNLIEANRPTFEIAGDVTVQEDSGAYSAPFVSNANANDPGQEITGYFVGDISNISLFSVPPFVFPDGTLTFTLRDDANGTSTAAVVALDNWFADPRNGASDPIPFTITVTSTDDPPVLTQTSPAASSENSIGSFPFPATDKFGAGIGYELSGVDGSLFEMNLDGPSLQFRAAPDYESPNDANSDNTYEVTITANGSDGTTVLDLEVQVTDVDEAPTAPVIGNNTVPENTSFVGIVSASDPEGSQVVLELDSGDDAPFFTFDPNTGELAFITPPDFENPTDGNGDNTYRLAFSSTDPAQNNQSSDISVVVTNVSQVPTPPLLETDRLVELSQTLVGQLSSSAEPGELITYHLVSGWIAPCLRLSGTSFIS